MFAGNMPCFTWRKVPDFTEWLAHRVKAEFAVQHFLAPGGTKEPPNKAERGER